jgi:hypothetical protein
MARYSIIREDNAVVVDGEHYIVDCSSLPANIHAIQWNNGRGHIEFVDDDPNDGKRDPNRAIDDFSPYQHLIETWKLVKSAGTPPVPNLQGLAIPAMGAHVIAD